MAEKAPCPNCLELAEKTGNKIVCEACDATFTVTKTGPAKVDKLGWKEGIEERVKRAEDQIAELLGGDDPEPEGQEETEPEEDQEEPFLPE